MRRKLNILFLISFLSFFSNIAAQKQYDSLDIIYRLDPILHNGKLYSYRVPANTNGHQFLNTTEFKTGKAWIKGIEYQNLLLNYDVLNQNLLLKYTKPNGFVSTIILSDAWLNRFVIDEKVFMYFKNGENDSRIFQVLGNDSTCVLYYWTKEIKLSESSGSGSYTVTKPTKKSFILTNNKLTKFKNNKSFTALFALNKQKNIKLFLRKHNIKVNKASEKEMLQLIKYCNNI